jgi:amino-acid N-acetyltransferase
MFASLRTTIARDWPAVKTLLEAEGLPIAGAPEHFASFFVAELDGVFAGVAGLEHYAQFALLRSVAVSPFARGRGLGRCLIEHALSSARANRVEAVYLLTTDADVYFSQFGFRQLPRERVPLAVHRSQEFTGACPGSASAMMRELNRQHP